MKIPAPKRVQKKSKTKRFSIKIKLILVFVFIILATCISLSTLAVNVSAKAVTERVSEHILEKAESLTRIIDGRINRFFQFIIRFNFLI